MKDFNFKKKYGQNFLKDKNIINNIVEKSKIDNDTLVIEIGVGAGALTFSMNKYAKNVIGYEIDRSLEEYLYSKLNETNNVEIIFDDFLKRDVEKDIEKYNYKKLYVVANLPYYITTPIIEKVINLNILVEKIVVMVQKEVGDRFKAVVGTKEYNSLSIYLEYYFEIRKIIDVSRNCFIPKPNIDSIVVEMKRRKEKFLVKDESKFFKLVRDSFMFKRKNLKNNLKGYNLSKIEDVLKKYNLDLTVRAENLCIDQFVDISNNL